MLEIRRTARSEDYPTVSRHDAIATLWTALPAALFSRTGDVLAANKLGSWIAGLSPARELLDRNVFDLSGQLLAQGRVPPECNLPFILKKSEHLDQLDAARRRPVHRFFSSLLEAEGPPPSGTCPPSHSTWGLGERSPWQYPLRLRRLEEGPDQTLLEFAVVEARVHNVAQFLIVLQPDGRETERAIRAAYDRHDELFPDEDYVFARPRVDIKYDQFYTQLAPKRPRLRIVTIERMGGLEGPPRSAASNGNGLEAATEGSRAFSIRPLIADVPVFELRPGQQLARRDVQRICAAIDAEVVSMPEHPLLGKPDSFKLSAAAKVGMLQGVDIFLRRPIDNRAVATVHRLDDLGERQSQHYVFDVGQLTENGLPALSFVSTDAKATRAVTIYKGGHFAEVTSEVQPVAPHAAIPAASHGSAGAERPTFSVSDAITAPEAARQLGLSRGYVHRLLETGRLRGMRVGDLWLVDKTAVRDWKPAPRGRPRRT